MSTVAVKLTDATVLGNERVSVGDITGGTSDYVNGVGYTFTAAQLGLYSLKHIRFENRSTGLIPQWSVSNGIVTLQIFYPTGGTGSGSANTVTSGAFTGTLGSLTATATPAVGVTDVTSTSAQPAIPVAFAGVPGGSSASGTINPGPGTEVASATDLHLAVFPFFAYGS
jgi:hypothetical protein